MTSLSIRITAGLAALAGAAVVTACSTATTTREHATHESTSHESTGASASAPSSATSAASATPADPSAGHDAEDVTFAQMMIPHHQQAVELSALVPDRSTDPDLLKLASAIADQQQPEIDTMRRLLTSWGVNPDDAGAHAGHGDGAMAGMVDEETMSKLATLSGAEFDQLWLTSMIAHHRGAIEMANTEIDGGQNSDMLELARNIVTAQQAEIDQMTAMLSGAGG